MATADHPILTADELREIWGLLSRAERRPAAALLLLLALAACGPGGAERLPPVKAHSSRPASRAGSAAKPDERWAFDWRRWHEPEQILRVDAGALVLGPADGALRRAVFIEPESTRDVLYFTRTYGPATLRGGDGVLAF